MAVEVDQGGARQRGGLDADPQQAEVLAHGHERHRRQEQQQTARENGLRLIAEKPMFFAVEMPRMALAVEVADTVDCSGQEQTLTMLKKRSPIGSSASHPPHAAPAARPRRTWSVWRGTVRCPPDARRIAIGPQT